MNKCAIQNGWISSEMTWYITVRLPCGKWTLEEAITKISLATALQNHSSWFKLSADSKLEQVTRYGVGGEALAVIECMEFNK